MIRGQQPVEIQRNCCRSMSVIAVGRPGGWSQQSRASVLSNWNLCRIIAIYIIPIRIWKMAWNISMEMTIFNVNGKFV